MLQRTPHDCNKELQLLIFLQLYKVIIVVKLYSVLFAIYFKIQAEIKEGIKTENQIFRDQFFTNLYKKHFGYC